MRSVPQSFYKCKEWKQCRESFLTANSLCARCLQEGRIEPAVIVHHKTHLNPENVKDPSISLNFENLEGLCQSCHNREHFGDKTERRWRFVDGELETKE